MVLVVGDAGVGGGGLGMLRVELAAGMGTAGVGARGFGCSVSGVEASDGAGTGFVRIFGACASGVMASLSRVEASVCADVEVMAGGFG